MANEDPNNNTLYGTIKNLVVPTELDEENLKALNKYWKCGSSRWFDKSPCILDIDISNFRDGRQLVYLENCTVQDFKESKDPKHQFHLHNIAQPTRFGPMSMLHETGAISNHLFQPMMNFRRIDYNNLYNERFDKTTKEIVPPLIESLIDDADAANNIWLTSPYCMFMYAVSDKMLPAKNKTMVRLRTHCNHHFFPDPKNKQNWDRSDTELLFGELQGRSGRLMNMKDFKRLLEVFGIRPMIVLTRKSNGNVNKATPAFQDEEPVTLKHVACFVKTVSQFELTTSDKIKEFLEHFHFENIYMYDDRVSPEQNVRQLGWLIRGIQSCREGSPDGQHRGNPLTQMLRGYNILNNEAPLEEQSFEQLLQKLNVGVRLSETKKEELEAWSRGKLAVIFPMDPRVAQENNMQLACEMLKDYGKKLTKNQGRSIKPTILDVIRDILNTTRLMSSIPRMTFKNYLAKKVCGTGAALCTDFVISVMNHVFADPGEDDPFRFVAKKNSDANSRKRYKSYAETIKYLSDRKTFGKSEPIINKWDNYSSEAKHEFALLCEIVRMTAWCPRSPNAFMKWLENPKDSTPQETIIRRYDRFQKLSWLMSFVIPCAYVFWEKIKAKIAVERFWIRFLCNYCTEDNIVGDSKDLGTRETLWRTHILYDDRSITKEDGMHPKKFHGTDGQEGLDFTFFTTLKPEENHEFAKELKSYNLALSSDKDPNNEMLNKRHSVLHGVLAQSSYYEIIQDIMDTIFEYGYDPVIPNTDGKNTYYHWYKKYGEVPCFFIPSTSIGSMSSQNNIKYSMEFLLVAYFNELNGNMIVDPKEHGIQICFPFLGSAEAYAMRKGKKVQSVPGICFSNKTASAGIPEEFKSLFKNGFGFLLQRRWRFKTFVESVLLGAIDTDQMKGFNAHCKAYINNQASKIRKNQIPRSEAITEITSHHDELKKKRVLANRGAGGGSGGGERSEEQKELARAIKRLKPEGFYNTLDLLLADAMHGGMVQRGSHELSDETVGKIFQDLLSHGAIKSISMDKQVVKKRLAHLYQLETIPDEFKELIAEGKKRYNDALPREGADELEAEEFDSDDLDSDDDDDDDDDSEESEKEEEEDKDDEDDKKSETASPDKKKRKKSESRQGTELIDETLDDDENENEGENSTENAAEDDIEEDHEESVEQQQQEETQEETDENEHETKADE